MYESLEYLITRTTIIKTSQSQSQIKGYSASKLIAINRVCWPKRI